MKIDLSSIFLVIIVVIPGLFAKRAKALLVPDSVALKGASEELAELVALGLATHALLAFAAAAISIFAGWLTQTGTYHLFRRVDQWNPAVWCHSHLSEAFLLGAAYVFVSFLVSHCLGLIYGAFTLKGGITARLLDRATWLERYGIRGLLGDRPIIYELLNPELNAEGIAKKIFVEAHLKSDQGFYSGQVSQFAIVRDEEPHKPVFLIDPWYKKEVNDQYIALAADGILLDLADIAILLVRQVDTSLPQAEEPR